ncbi:radical SAM protein [Patescibacteria group bacterium]|nr:radical SAM protein [Patescibacteria group bacterium]MBU1906631.1 radical SAM protein [Patescibacteria group bacterium]
MNLKLSSLTHQFTRPGTVAFYNSLSLRPIFLGEEVAKTIQTEFASPGTDPDDFISRYSQQIKGCDQLIEAMQQTKILVGADVSETEVIKWFAGHHTGHPYISIMYLILTDRCNLGCDYCFIVNKFDEEHSCADMSTATANAALQTFARAAKQKPEHFDEEKTIILYGGEPTMNKATLRFILEKIAEMKQTDELPEKTVVSLNTNGTLFTPELAKLLKEHRVAVAISVDGDQWAHDSARHHKNGQPTYQEVLKGIQVCRDNGLEVGLSCTLNQASIDRFDETLDMIINKLKIMSLGFNIVLSGPKYPLGVDYDLTASQKIIKAFQRFRQLGIVEDRIMRKIDSFVKGEVYAFDCGATGGGQLVVAPDGRIGICHGYLGTGKYFSGHVNDASYDPLQDPGIQEWSRRSPLNMTACHNCSALGICGGGCPMYADDLKGNIWELDERFCIHAKTTLEWMIWDLYEQSQQ